MEAHEQEKRQQDQRQQDRQHDGAVPEAGRESPARAERPFHYQSLMKHLVRDILMVASAYDCFILEEDGRFADRLLNQYVELDLSSPPHFRHVASAREALELVRSERFDLVLTTPHCADMRAERLAAELAAEHSHLPVAMLTYDLNDALRYSQMPRSAGIDETFLWLGDPKLLVALVKSIEDHRNVDRDTREGMVRVILLVEDSPSFYSSYLPIIYGEVVAQFQSLLAERLNERDRRHRMRARPKILLARNWEEAVDLFQRYSEYLLGTICDMRFPRGGRLDPDAGRDFIRLVRDNQADAPVLLQSGEPRHAEVARELKVHFADKNSKELLARLGEFIRNNFGFGPFRFQLPDGKRLAEAVDMEAMVEALRTVPDASLLFHGRGNHISNWLMARSEFGLAQEVRPKKVGDFPTTADLRAYLVNSFSHHLETRQRGEIAEFARHSVAITREFSRLGSGSMGGKGRGIAFLSHLLVERNLQGRYPEVRVRVPRTVVIGTDLFDRFCEHENLRQRALEASTDKEVVQLFLAQPLPKELDEDLDVILGQMHVPIAVRSSSLHEDSESLPLAGLFKSYMLPNCSRSDQVRKNQLSRAIRLIYATPFLHPVRSYIEASALRVEEEKMAVIIQELVGRRHGDYFYPDFAGVAQSYNYYPLRFIQPDDGIATVALGLGQTIVRGRKALRFSPRYPRILPQMSTPQDALSASQREFFALDLSDSELEPQVDEDAHLVTFGLDVAEQHGTLEALGATYSADNDAIYDTIYRDGARLVNFAGVLKHGRFPLAPLLTDLLAMGQEGMGTPIEMEFAVTLPVSSSAAGSSAAGTSTDPKARPEIALLQLRPLVTQSGDRQVDIDELPKDCVPLIVGSALGNGVICGIRDVVYVNPDLRFEADHNRRLARQIEVLNHRLSQASRPYILIGPGRWGTADPWLGIPVTWAQVSAARVIVELELPNSHIDASQGTHFFHNLTSLRIGYFGVDLGNSAHHIDLDWLRSLKNEAGAGFLHYVELPQEVEVHIDGRTGRGVVVRVPESEATT